MTTLNQSGQEKVYTIYFYVPGPNSKWQKADKEVKAGEWRKSRSLGGRKLTILTAEDEQTAPRYDERLCVNCTSIKT